MRTKGRRIARPAAFAAVFALGVLAGWWIPRRVVPPPPILDTEFQQVRESGFRFINPLLECEIAENLLMRTELKVFKYKVQELVDRVIAGGRARHVSVYFRELNNGPWYGINEKENFAPASLMKLPLLMAYLKQAETDPTVLQRTLVNDNTIDLSAMQNYKPKESIVPGRTYTVEDLLHRMMAYSDNNAWALLFRNINATSLDKILHDLNVAYVPGVDEDYLTVKSYSSFLRILYNASYLNKEMSERALELMSLDDFPQGIAAGVPAGIQVASKFGERVTGEGDDATQEDMKQLHEFGIVYFPRRPYLLGIMTRGNDFDTLAGVIRDISKLIYEEVARQANGPEAVP